MRYILLSLIFSFISFLTPSFGQDKQFTRQDSLRGTNNEFRNWWNVLRYDIEIEPVFEKKFLNGKNSITFEVTEKSHNGMMQIDLQEPMQLDEIRLDETIIKDSKREGNVYFIPVGKLKHKSKHTLSLKFSGNPRIAVNPPWDGGWIFVTDREIRPWMTVACQGLGASSWYPNKDYQGDEPDNGASVNIVVPEGLMGVSNGKLIEKGKKGDKLTYKWEVKNPINNYNIVPYIGHYVEIKDSYLGENGELDVNYWVLDYNLDKAKKHFVQAKTMLEKFEYWMGPYPFFEDGYKLVDAPHLGMEHQSGVAYGNYYVNGYLGQDLSNSGWGLKWDFIIIHESGHEWFGNNITTNDVADMWVHEGFTSYSETLYNESLFGKEAGSDYVIGTRSSIANDTPIIGPYGVSKRGSTDMYFKGANMIHTLRQWIDDDELFREILRGLNKDFYHSTVDTEDVERYFSQKTGLELQAFFDQYLRTVKVPVLEYKIDGNKLSYRWTNTVEDFQMPVKISETEKWLKPTNQWKTEELEPNLLNNFKIDRNFYIRTQRVN